jgi:probable rRNA maturation factor
MTGRPKYDVNLQLQLEPALVLPEHRLVEAVGWVLAEHRVAPGTGISLVITTDEEMRRFNRQFRGVDTTTDTLSFPADPPPIPEEEPYLGDLILALPYIERQAAAEQHSMLDELILAIIHGTLHLLGYDHDTAERQAAMWAVQEKALAAMAIDIVVPLFEFPVDKPDLVPGLQDDVAQ